MAIQQTVNAGDCFSQRLKHWDSRYLVWRVKSVSNTAMDVPHAQLINVRDPWETRTISCRTLANAAFYERLEGRAPSRANAAAEVLELTRKRGGHSDAGSATQS